MTDAMTSQLNDEGNAQVSNHEYWETYAAFVNMYNPELKCDIDILMQVRGSDYFADHVDRLRRIAGEEGCSLGKAMFGWALPKAYQQYMQRYLEHLLVYPEGRLLTPADKDEIETKAIDEGDRIGATKVAIRSRGSPARPGFWTRY